AKNMMEASMKHLQQQSSSRTSPKAQLTRPSYDIKLMYVSSEEEVEEAEDDVDGEDNDAEDKEDDDAEDNWCLRPLSTNRQNARRLH
ncbi:hypothetical protein BGZ49_002484, partial [Haplosporangium sp. Z 27]